MDMQNEKPQSGFSGVFLWSVLYTIDWKKEIGSLLPIMFFGNGKI